MDNVLEIVLRVKDEATAALTSAGKQIDNTRKNIEGMGKSFQMAGGMLTGAGIAGVAVMKDWVDAANNAQVETIRFNTILSNTASDMKTSFMKLSEEATKTSAAMVQLGFDDEETSTVFAKSIAITKDVTKANEMVAASADLARYKGIGMADAGMAVQKAMMGNTKILKELGINVKDVAGSEEVLAAIREKAAGQAEHYADTYAGQMDRLNVQINNIKESLGDRLLPIVAEITSKVGDFVQKINELDPAVFDLAVKIVGVGTAFTLVGGPLLFLIGSLPMLASGFTLLTGTLAVPIAIIAALAAASYSLYAAWTTNFGGIQQVMAQVFAQATVYAQQFIGELSRFWIEVEPRLIPALNNIQALISFIFTSIATFISQNMDLIQLSIASAWSNITTAAQVAWQVIQGVILVVLDLIGGNFQAAGADWNKMIGNVWTLLQKNTSVQLNAWHDAIVIIAGKIGAVFSNMAANIMSALSTIKFPHLSLGEGSSTVAGMQIKYPKLDVAWYQQGGWVPNTGLAMLHGGEFVMSRDMLEGRKAPPSSVSDVFNQPISISASISSDVDIDSIGYRLAWVLRNSR